MTRPPKTTAPKSPDTASQSAEGERIAKVLSRAGVASRREAERMIQLGQVAVNGKVIDSPALNVTPRDRITVDGQPVGAPEPARLWLYYKPEGLVTSASDEKGRETIFDYLPPDLPRVMTVGRLDLNSEGLLLLTNDGELKRKLELPSTGWLRKYRVRVKGTPMDPDLDPLRRGITVEGENFQPMIVTLDRVQGANAWLTVGLREGKNREIRRAMSAIELTVNRLIRVSYGPFRLGDMEPGDVEEVKGRVLRDQLGQRELPEDAVEEEAPRRGPPKRAPTKSVGAKSVGANSVGANSTGANSPAARPAAASRPNRSDTPVRGAAPGPAGKPVAAGPRGPAVPPRPAKPAGQSRPPQTESADTPPRPKPASTKGWAKAAPKSGSRGATGARGNAGPGAGAGRSGGDTGTKPPKPRPKGE